MTVLIVTADPLSTPDSSGLPAALAAALERAGHTVLGAVPCHLLVREVIRRAPQVVVAWLGDGPADAAALPPSLAAALQLLAAGAPRPVVVAGAATLPGDVDHLLDLHLQAWLPGPPNASALQAAIGLALARFAREQAQQLALHGAQARLDERKWVDKAKGLLMRGQQLSEDGAFSLLRAASMQANLRVGEVSRSLIEAARAADAINRAGQLRMLSQHCVKALALRASTAGTAGSALGRLRTDDGLEQTLQRLQRNLDHLASLRPDGPVAAWLAGALSASQALAQVARESGADPARAGSVARPWPQVLQQADGLAEALLVQADGLTAALEVASGRRSLRLVNLCGRQRMLSQRLAKQALLAGLLGPAEAAAQATAAVSTMQAFEATMAFLEQAPLATDAIRAALAQARGQWQRLLDGLRSAAGAEPDAGRNALASESQALLATFEQLTSLYEHSMQVLLG